MILLVISTGWAQSDEWKTRIWDQVDFHMSTQDALPPLLEIGRALYPGVEQWEVVDVSVDFSTDVVDRYFIKDVTKGGGVAPYLRGMSALIERSALSLTPRRSPAWGEVMPQTDSPELASYRQMGTMHHYTKGNIEAITVDERYWSTEAAYSFSDKPYYNYWQLMRYIFIYRDGVALGVYIRDSEVDLYPDCTKEEWESRESIRDPDWDSLMGRADVSHYEHIFVFHYNDARSLSKVELFKFANLTPVYIRYAPVSPPPARAPTP